MTSRRDLGQMGESTLILWANQEGLIVNKARDKDAAGWDFIIEWPLGDSSRDAHLPLDRAPAPTRCVVQVKSTDSETGKCQVKLSNWWYLLTNPLPAFFLILEFGGSNKCQRAFLVHVGEHLIGKILKRLRKISLAPEPHHLNRKTAILKWTSEDALASLDGKRLQQKIASFMPDGFDAYFHRKSALLKSLGYEGGQPSATLMFTTSGGQENIERLVDFQLGLADEMPFESAESLDTRFGITVPLERIEGGTIERLGTPTGTSGTLSLVASSGKKHEMPCDILAPSGAGQTLPERLLKVRLLGGPWSFVLPLGGDQTASFSYEPEEPSVARPLPKLHDAATIILLLNESYATEEPIRLAVLVEGQERSRGTLQAPKPPDQEHIQWAGIVQDAWLIAEHFGVAGDIEVSPAALEHESLKLRLVSRLISGENPRVRIKFDSERRPPGSVLCVPLPITVFLGTHKAQLAVMLIGKILPGGEAIQVSQRYELESTGAEVCFESMVRTEAEGKTAKQLCSIAGKRCPEGAELVILEG